MTSSTKKQRIKSQFDIVDNVEILVIDVEKKIIVDRFEDCNLFVLVGRNLVRDFLNNISVTGVTHLAVGTGATSATSADSALETEVARGALTKRTPSTGSVILSYYLSSTQANGNTVSEAGLFNASSGPSMFARVTHAGIIKTSSLAIMYNWSLNIGAS